MMMIKKSKSLLNFFEHFNNFLVLNSLPFLYHYFVFSSNVAVLLSINFKPSYRFITNRSHTGRFLVISGWLLAPWTVISHFTTQII